MGIPGVGDPIVLSSQRNPRIGTTVTLLEYLPEIRESKEIMCKKDGCGCKKFLVFPHQVFKCERCATEAENFRNRKISEICNLSSNNNLSNFYWTPTR